MWIDKSIYRILRLWILSLHIDVFISYQKLFTLTIVSLRTSLITGNSYVSVSTLTFTSYWVTECVILTFTIHTTWWSVSTLPTYCYQRKDRKYDEILCYYHMCTNGYTHETAKPWTCLWQLYNGINLDHLPLISKCHPIWITNAVEVGERGFAYI